MAKTPGVVVLVLVDFRNSASPLAGVVVLEAVHLAAAAAAAVEDHPREAEAENPWSGNMGYSA